jgi:telomere length regulation protein
VSLQHPDLIVQDILKLSLDGDVDRKRFLAIIDCLGAHEQQTFLNGALRLLSRDYLGQSTVNRGTEWWKEDSDVVGAGAGYLKLIVSQNESRKSHLIAWLTSSTGAGVGDSIGIRRAVIAALSDSKYDLDTLLENSLQQFGDQLYIRHTPSLQQEGRYPFIRALFLKGSFHL